MFFHKRLNGSVGGIGTLSVLGFMGNNEDARLWARSGPQDAKQDRPKMLGVKQASYCVRALAAALDSRQVTIRLEVIL